MPATPLPPSGDLPTGPKTCDASGMIEIHRMFKRGFGEAPALVRLVAEGDTAHAAAVATQLETLSMGLHAHHEAEDERLWGALEERAPSCATHVLASQPDGGEEWMHKNLPAPARLAWRLIGKRKYAAHRAALAGR